MNFKSQKITALILCFFTFLTCSNDEELKNTDQNLNIESSYFLKSDISKIKDWMSNQSDLGNLKDDFPLLEFKIEPKDISNKELVAFYENGIMYLNDDIRAGQNLNYDHLKEQVLDDTRLNLEDKKYLLSFCQLSSEVLTSKFYADFVMSLGSNAQQSGCNCNPFYDVYITRMIQCNAYGDYWGHCTSAKYYYNLWQSCLGGTTTCPPGFTYDGANCYSGITIPAGYHPFTWGNGFYVQRNCNISTADNCCPTGFGFDGANCHYWTVYYPSNYEPFIWGNSFYVKAKCL